MRKRMVYITPSLGGHTIAYQDVLDSLAYAATRQGHILNEQAPLRLMVGPSGELRIGAPTIDLERSDQRDTIRLTQDRGELTQHQLFGTDSIELKTQLPEPGLVLFRQIGLSHAYRNGLRNQQ